MQVRLLLAVLCLTGGSMLPSVVAQGGDDTFDCNKCPSEYAPVCAEHPISGVVMTVAHRCYAVCQSMASIRAGSCGTSGDDVQAAAAASAEANAFDYSTACKPSLADLKAHEAEGMVFLGCAKVGSASDATAAAAAAAAPEPSQEPTTVASMLAAAKPDEELVLVKDLLDEQGHYLYRRADRQLAHELLSALSAAGGGDPRTPSRRAPTPEKWGKYQTKRVKKSRNTADRKTKVGAAAAVADEPVVLNETFYQDTPMDAPGTERNGSGRHLLQGDNRWPVSSTTTWPWPAMVHLNVIGCSGTLISPDDVLTAAHCVRDSVSGSWRDPGSIIPGFNPKVANREPYGRFGYTNRVTWAVWPGGAYNGRADRVPGSAYVDVGLIRLNRPVTWWLGTTNDCGSKRRNLRACGYPGNKNFAPFCSDGGVDFPTDYCDGVPQYWISSNCYTTGGQSGGPVFDAGTGGITALVSGGLADLTKHWYTPLDIDFNWQLLFATNQESTIWSQSRRFRMTNGIIKTSLNGKCLDVWGAQFVNGARVSVSDCHSGANQLWMRPTDGLNDLQLRTGNNFCLDVNGASTANGASIIVHQCHGGTNQRWFFDSMRRLRPWHAANKCLDISGGNTASGANLVLWDCHTGNNQQWYM